MSAELCRHPEALQAFRRHRAQENEAIVQVKSFFIEERDFVSYTRGEPISAVERHILFAMPDVGPAHLNSPPAVCNSGPTLADRRAVVINTLIASPDQPATLAWKELMYRQFNRILKFARTAVNKGKQVDPAFR